MATYANPVLMMDANVKSTMKNSPRLSLSALFAWLVVLNGMDAITAPGDYLMGIPQSGTMMGTHYSGIMELGPRFFIGAFFRI